MTTMRAIVEHLQALPEKARSEVLDFVEFLESKAEKPREKVEDLDWSALSLASAMRGMEDEESAYSLDDLKESFT